MDNPLSRLNRAREQWAKLKPDAFLTGSIVQARNVLEMAQQDIERLYRRIDQLEAERQHDR